MENLILKIKSDNPISLSIPNPSDELKQHAFDSIMSKVIVIPVPQYHACACQDEVATTAEFVTEPPRILFHTDKPFEGTITLAKDEPKTPELIIQTGDQTHHSGKSMWEESDVTITSFHEPLQPKDIVKPSFSELVKTHIEEEPEEENDHFKTGFKIKNGKKSYKCRYKCTNATCGMESNQYIWAGTSEVECHGCGNKLRVKKATSDVELERDPFGNFYVAGKRQPYFEINKY